MEAEPRAFVYAGKHAVLACDVEYALGMLGIKYVKVE